MQLSAALDEKEHPEAAEECLVELILDDAAELKGHCEALDGDSLGKDPLR